MAQIETLIREVATNKLPSKYNLAQYKEGGAKHEEKLNAILHKRICEEVVAFADNHKHIPFYFILSVGIAKGAYKMSAFLKGYKRFDADEVRMVYKFGQAYYAYNEQYRKKMSDVAIRLIMRYYERVSHDYSNFLVDLNNSKKLGKECGSRNVQYKMLCNNLNIPYDEEMDRINKVA